jgi:hypothetical protein
VIGLLFSQDDDNDEELGFGGEEEGSEDEAKESKKKSSSKKGSKKVSHPLLDFRSRQFSHFLPC